MSATPRIRLLSVSALALFLELALIRYLGSEIRIFAYYKNLVLIACFLGFGVGFYRAAARSWLATSVAVLLGTVGVVRATTHFRWEYGPTAATRALSNFAGTLTMGEQNVQDASDAFVLIGFGWALSIFMACLVIMFGFAQQIGREIEAFGPQHRLEAYSWNVFGSLLGIAAFSVASWLALGPMFWFPPAALLATAWLTTRLSRGLALACAPLLALVLIEPSTTIWSPYQRLDLVETPRHVAVMVNGTGYMSLESFKANASPHDRWRLPHTIRPHARNVLVIGAGGGNDVSAALQAGATRVVAVEIDPEILKLGRAKHADAPYADPRVHVVIDDARHYGEVATERFDLIVFSHLDSHTALSGFTNVRLDNYIYTVESFNTFRRLLNPNGALYVSFFSTKRWVAERLRANLRQAFGEDPVRLYSTVVTRAVNNERSIGIEATVLNAHFVATQSPQVRLAAERVSAASFAPLTDAPVPPTSTDDWPYLFVEDRHIPIPMFILAVMLAGVSALFIAFHIQHELRSGGRFPIDRQYFFLGAGFLLVEVHNVGKLARVFGTTWSVNAWVIAAVLSVILLANALVSRYPRLCNSRAAYAALLVSLVTCANVSVETLLSWPLAPVVVMITYTSPLLFAGVIFATAFRDTAHPMRALGSNLLGSLLGGFLELASFAYGLSALLYIAAMLYMCSFPLRLPSKQTALPHDGSVARV